MNIHSGDGLVAKSTDAQKQDRRQQLLDAALRCFSRNGFHNTTMADIAREAGVAPGTFYLYFSTKDDVIAALADDRRQGEALINSIAGAEVDPIVGLTLMLELHGQSLSDPRRNDERRVAVQGWAEALRSDAIRGRLATYTSRVTEELARLIERGQRTGQFKPDADPEAVARSIVALFRGLTLQAAWDEAYDPTLISNAVADMIQGALAPAGGPAKPVQTAQAEEGR
jgi:AcrR family transcriptional regulator